MGVGRFGPAFRLPLCSLVVEMTATRDQLLVDPTLTTIAEKAAKQIAIAERLDNISAKEVYRTIIDAIVSAVIRPDGIGRLSLNQESRDYPEFDNPRDPYASKDRLPPGWQCAGRKQSLPEPGECDWPSCGCDPHATKVIEALIEQGWKQHL